MTKVVVVVHGMGDHKRNDALRGLVRPVLDLIHARGNPGKLGPQASGTLAFDAPAAFDITYGDQQWRFTEYWWGQVFRPPSVLRTSLWIMRRLLWHLRSLRTGLMHAWRDLWHAEGQFKDPLVARLYHVPAILLYSLGVLLAWPLSLALVLLLLILSAVKVVPGVPWSISLVSRVLRAFAVDSLGDIHIYFQDGVQGPQICGGLVDLLNSLGGGPDVTEVFVVAHSTGAVIAYEALSRLTPGDPAHKKLKALVTIGAILNMSWDHRIVRHDRFKQPIPEHVRWYNLWTRYDYGAAPGEIGAEGRPWLHPAMLKNRRVSNYEDLLMDHTAYWWNHEQVVSLLLEELGGLDSANDFWRGAPGRPEEGWKSRSTQAWKDYDLRRGIMAALGLTRLPAVGAALALAPLYLVMVLAPGLAAAIGRAVSGWYRLTWLPWGATDFTERVRLDVVADWVAGAAGHLGSGGFFWVRLSSPGVITVGLMVVPAGLFLLHLLIAGLWWRGWARRRRDARHAAFKAWREAGRP